MLVFPIVAPVVVARFAFLDHHLVEGVVHVLIIKADVEMISFVGGSSSQA